MRPIEARPVIEVWLRTEEVDEVLINREGAAEFSKIESAAF